MAKEYNPKNRTREEFIEDVSELALLLGVSRIGCGVRGGEYALKDISQMPSDLLSTVYRDLKDIKERRRGAA